MLATMKAEVRWQSVCITWMYFDQVFSQLLKLRKLYYIMIDLIISYYIRVCCFKIQMHVRIHAYFIILFMIDIVRFYDLICEQI